MKRAGRWIAGCGDCRHSGGTRRCTRSGARRKATSRAWSGARRVREAGVWVIAETKDLPTNFIKIVVTDDQGRFVLPDLPAANYRVWVRGYGLVDSTPIADEAGATDR